MEGIRAELSVADLCRKHSISQPTFYKWTKYFVEAGKKRLSGDDLREATSDEVKEICKQNSLLKESLADLVIRYYIVKKAWICSVKCLLQEAYEIISSIKSGNCIACKSQPGEYKQVFEVSRDS